MRTLATVALFGAALLAAPVLLALPTPAVAPLAVAGGVALAVVASDGVAALAVALGALGALAYVGLAESVPAVAGGILVAAALGARASRARSPVLGGAYTLAALVTGAAAAWIAARFAGDTVAVQLAAAVVCGLVASLTRALPVDDPVAHALWAAAREAPAQARTTLVCAVHLRRRVGDAPEGLGAPAAARLERAWHALVRVARRRRGATHDAARVIDRKVAAHYAALARVYTAADDARALGLGGDEAALLAVRCEGEALSAQAAALAEVAADAGEPVANDAATRYAPGQP